MDPKSDIGNTPWENDSGHIAPEKGSFKKEYTRTPIFLTLALLAFFLITLYGVSEGFAAQNQVSWFPVWLIIIGGYILGAMTAAFALAVISALRKERYLFLRTFIFAWCGIPVALFVSFVLWSQFQ